MLTVACPGLVLDTLKFQDVYLEITHNIHILMVVATVQGFSCFAQPAWAKSCYSTFA